jgi:hypothetical protein
MKLMGRVGLTVVALGSFAAVSTGLRGALAAPEGDEFGPKLAYLEQHLDEYDTLFLGSSAIFRQVMPLAFDERRAELGAPTRSFNLGSPGMSGLEADHALFEVFELLGERPGGRVYFEPTRPVACMLAGQETTERSIAWHDLRGLLAALQLVSVEHSGWREALGVAADHLRCFTWNRSNYAQGQRLLRGLMGDLPGPLTPAAIAAGAGYQALEDSRDPSVILRGVAFAGGADSEAAGRLVRATEELRMALARRSNSRLRETPEGQRLLEQWAEAQARGIPFSWLVAPSLKPFRLARALRPRGLEFLAYNDPDRHPELFAPEAHFDKNHLDRQAARAFTRLLAEDTVGGR